MANPATQYGFSLVELIVVIVLLGVLGGIGSTLILRPIEAYEDQLRRQQLVDQAEMALRQIARDVRRALPNSVRITSVGSGWALEMVNSVDGARYRDQPGPGFGNPADRLQFIPVGDSSFNLLGSFQTLTAPSTLAADQRLVIYPTSSGIIYADAAGNANPGIMTPASTTINLVSNNPGGVDPEQQLTLSAAHRFSLQSPQQRLFVVDGPISYLCNPATGQISRYARYNYRVNQPTTAADFTGGNSGLVVSLLESCAITYEPGTSQRAGVLTVSIEIEDAGEPINLLHQIQVLNAP